MWKVLPEVITTEPGCRIELGYLAGFSRRWETVAHLGTVCRIAPKSDISFLRDTMLKGTFAYIRKGCLHSIIRMADGAERLKLVVDEGCLIYEAWCAAGSCERACYHHARNSVELVCFDGRLLHDTAFQISHPGLIANAFRSACIKYNMFDALLDAAYKKTALEKVAWYLAKLCMHNGGSLHFSSRLSQGEVASLLTISSASMKRAVSALKNEGILEAFTRSSVDIIDKKRLFDKAGIPGELP